MTMRFYASVNNTLVCGVDDKLKSDQMYYMTASWREEWKKLADDN